MQRYQFDYKPVHDLPAQWHELVNRAQTLFLDAYKKPYQDGYSVVNVPFDTDIQAQVVSLAQQKKLLNIRMLIVIGIGGSNLGTKAVHEFLHGIYYNDINQQISCYFVDTLDADTMNVVIECMQQTLVQGQEVLINVISKSGTTTETTINFNIFLTILKQYRPDTYRSYIVVTSDSGSLLSHIALQEQFSLLEIPPVIGGRFSVFTAVGLFPLSILGVDIIALCAGAQQGVLDVLLKDNNDAVQAAYVSYNNCMQGRIIHDMFVFGSELESFGLWYRQLFAESLGKSTTIGIMPTVSVGSTDLHSVGQLYLGGPYDKYSSFISAVQQHDCVFEAQPELIACMPSLKKKSMEFVMDAIIQGTQKAYALDNRPFESFKIFQKSAESIGQLLQWYMMRVVYMAHLFQVNPFDQPHVELYKRETRKIVGYE